MTSIPLDTCPPTLPGQLLGNAVESWRASVQGMTDYWTGALARGAMPLGVAADVARWWGVMSDRRPPTWATPNEVVLRTEIALARDFSVPSPTAATPTLILPPQAGHASCIVDYSTDQSQVGVARAAGLDRLYCMDWLAATQATSDASIEDYLEVVGATVDRIGGPVNLVGDCQGGWLAAIYAALAPDQVTTLTIAGAPIDFHAGGAVIHDYVELLGGRDDMSFYEAVVAAGGGLMKGEYMLNGFIAIKPENEISKQLGLLARLHEPDHVERYRAFEDWFKHTQDISGRFYLWIVEHLFRDNRLVAGELEVAGERVDLARIACPLQLLAGATDHITPPEQVYALRDAASTPAGQIGERLTGGGHLGLFMGREALHEHWPVLFAEVLSRSRGLRSTRRPGAGGGAGRRGQRTRGRPG